MDDRTAGIMHVVAWKFSPPSERVRSCRRSGSRSYSMWKKDFAKEAIVAAVS